MQKTIRYITARLYKPLLVRYLSSTRTYVYKGIRLLIPPAVFHPGFFHSTRLLLGHIGRQPLQGRSLLELGAGSGLISLFAAQKGAIVTAIDINQTAIEYLVSNSSRNELPIEIIRSDLFSHIPERTFDIIAINPPYYRKQPMTPAEHAWYCGENGEYFRGLFKGLRNYTHSRTTTWMVLNDACDLDMIRSLAAEYGWGLTCVWTKRNWLERNFIFCVGPLLAQESSLGS
jgi:release factor glutamine methyltransferase